MKQYKDLVEKILEEGTKRPDRTGVGTIGIFGHQMRFDLSAALPAVTLKKTFIRGAIEELLWMLRGETNVRPLQEKGVHIWDEWANEDGELGPVYGAQWRRWRGLQTKTNVEIDQIAEVLEGLEKDPFGRRHIVSAWNPVELPVPGVDPTEQAGNSRMALAPCHVLFQFHVEPNNQGELVLSCQLYQRSCDVFLGLPFNLVGYAALTHLIAHKLGYLVGDFIWTGGDTHLYLNHINQARQMIQREPLPVMPSLVLHHSREKDLESVTAEDIELIDYHSHPAIKAPVAK